MGFCQCDKCRALDSGQVIKEKGIDAEEAKPADRKNTSITDRIFTFANAVAREVQKTHPGKYVMNFAYSRYILPPQRIEIHPSVVPQYALWSAYRHANPKMKRRARRNDRALGQCVAAYRAFTNTISTVPGPACTE